MAITDIRTANEQVARNLMDEARRNPQSPYVGKFVGIANGQIVVVANDWDELAERMEQTVTDPSTTLSLEVGRDYDRVQTIWRLADAARPVAVGRR
ncbi:MAG TPA: hypothetical protein VHR66_26305 [Gemmataceae bacterium]|jgi:hypothetical protein|nr:hypothetical protein [Gemmataceae bacterium]